MKFKNKNFELIISEEQELRDEIELREMQILYQLLYTSLKTISFDGFEKLRTLFENHKIAKEVATRIADEWVGREEFPEDAETLKDVLTLLFTLHPEELNRLIGTGIYEGEEIIS